MANTKKFTLDYSVKGLTVYCIIRRESDQYLLNAVNGTFEESPSNPYLHLIEDSVIKGRYEVSESRAIWLNGEYKPIIYLQTGGSPVPLNDIAIGGNGSLIIINDTEWSIQSLERTTGLALENFVEDHITRDLNGNKLTSNLYCYDSAANATIHNKATGLIGKYAVTVDYSLGAMSRFKSVRTL